jgi:hypothetical protein
VSGISSAINKPVEMMKSMVTKVRRLLPFSPAKDGPLRDIHRIKLVETIAASIRPAPLVNAMRGVAGAAANVKSPMRGGGGGNVVFSPTINLYGGATEKDASMLTTAIRKEVKDLLQQHYGGSGRLAFQ